MKTLKTANWIKKIFFLTVLACFFSACDVSGSDNNNNDNCRTYIFTGVSDVTGPTTAAVNETITLNVSFKVNNSCGGFENFTTSDQGLATVITVLAKYDGCTCDDTPKFITAPYTFTATAPGTYSLKFKITDTTFITRAITVS